MADKPDNQTRSRRGGATDGLPRVVAVGFNKCGTRSLTSLFAGAGHKVIHHKLRRRFRRSRSIGRIMRENLDAGLPVLAGADDHIFYCDLIYSTPSGTFDGNSAFREILRDYPDTILLLNFRDREEWIRSRLRHGHGEFARREMQARGLSDEKALCEAWRREWDTHLAAVRAFMADRPGQLIEFDLDNDPVESLIDGLPEFGLSSADWQDVGRTRGRRRHPVVAAAKRLLALNRPRSTR